MQYASFHSKKILVILICLSATIGLLRFDSFQVGAFPDDAHYVVLAESLSSGQGYRLINFPFAPIDLAFPPGWPILLSPLVALFPGNFTVLKLLSLLFFLASLALTYKLFSGRIGTPYLEILIAWVALHPVMIGMSGMVMSEMAYLFFSLLALLLLESWRQRESNNWLLVVVAVLAVYTQLVRTIGLSILLTIVFFLLFSRRFKQLGIALLIIVLSMIPQMMLYTQAGGSFVSSGYQSQVLSGSLTAKLTHIWVNIQAYFDQIISGTLIPAFGPPDTQGLHESGGKGAFTILNILTLLFVAFGFILSLTRFHLYDLYVAIYFLGILFFWNPDAGGAQHRFLIPIIPFLYFYLLQAMRWLSLRVIRQDEKRSSVLVTVASGLIILLSLSANFMDLHNLMRNRTTNLSLGADWICKNSPSESIVMAKDPVSVYLYARRKTVPYPREGEDIEKYLTANGVNYILVSPGLQMPMGNLRRKLDELIETHMLPWFKSNPERFPIVYSNTMHNVTVYNCSNVRKPFDRRD